MEPSSSDKTIDLSHLVTTVLQQVRKDALKELAREGYKDTTTFKPSQVDMMTRLVKVIAYQSMQKQMQSSWPVEKKPSAQQSTSRVNRATGAGNSLRQQA